MDWRAEWSGIDDVVYLNTAAESPLPRVVVEAAERALACKQSPHQVPDSAVLEPPTRVRASLAALVGGRPDEIALTTGASTGVSIIAQGLAWQPGDEIVTAAGEFPLQYTTWAPLAARDGVTLRVATPSGPFLTGADVAQAITARTRLVSVSLVRFDDGVRLDASVVADACRTHGALLCLDVSQCCGAMSIDARALGADFLTGAGYKWLLSPYGTGFFWAKREHLHRLKPGPFYWRSAEGADDPSSLDLSNPRPAPNVSRWDVPEWAGVFNLNLTAMEAGVSMVERVGPGTVYEHNRRLIERLFERLPTHKVTIASPLDASCRGPFGCFRAQTLEHTRAMYEALRREGFVVSLREGKIRVSPYLFNGIDDIDRLVEVVRQLSGD